MMAPNEIPNLPVPASQPVPTPTDIVDGARTSLASGQYTIFAFFVLLGLARLLYWLAERYPTNRVVHALRLGSSFARAGLTGTIGVLAAAAFETTATTGMDYGVLIGTLGACVAVFLRPEPKGKPAEIPTSAPPPPVHGHTGVRG